MMETPGKARNILFIVQAPPYGSERVLSALRVATTLAHHEARPKIRVFMMSDAVVAGLAGQKMADAISLGAMLEEIISAGTEVKVCRTCVTARGLLEADWLPQVQIGTLPDLANWVLEADQVLSF